MRNKFMRFMYGRYGLDQLSKFLLWFSFILMILSSVIGLYPIYFISIVILVYSYFRIFSTNIQRRYDENAKFQYYWGKTKNYFIKKKRNIVIRKTHHIYRCPNCRQRIKIPKGKGKVAIKCPKCYTEFIKKS